jgi:hypothetical protein
VKIFSIVFVCLFTCSLLPAQKIHIGMAGGLANYNGDLLEKLYPKKITNGFIGPVIYYEINDRLQLRGSYSFARVNGSDTYNSKQSLRNRNLQFESTISEFSMAAEYHLFSLYEKKYTPFFFAGLAVFYFNPYAYDSLNRKHYLKPLSTEGQGIYPDKKLYSLWQPAIPFGGGLKFAITENLRLGIEFGFRKLFTDYLDDVSTSYPGVNDLLAAKGQEAVDYSFRGDELPGSTATFPTKGTQRGSSGQKDVYYFTGIHLTFRPSFGGGGYRYSGKKSKYGCPAVPL